MVLGMRLEFEQEQEVDGTYTVGSPLSLVFFKTGMVTDTSRHSYGRTEGIMLCGNSCLNPATRKRHFFQWKVLFLGPRRPSTWGSPLTPRT